MVFLYLRRDHGYKEFWKSRLLSVLDSTGAHREAAAAELEKMTKSKQTKRAHSDVNPNGPSSAS